MCEGGPGKLCEIPHKGVEQKKGERKQKFKKGGWDKLWVP